MALETLRRYREFCDSAAPASLSYYTNGAWTRFPNASLALARLAFAERRSAFMLNNAENVPFLVDVLRMAVVNSRTGEPRPLSWRDVNGRRYVHRAAAAAGDRADAANAEGEGENDGPDDDDNGVVICERDDEEAAKEDTEMKANERLKMFGARFVERMGLGVSGCVVVRVKRLRATPQHLQEYDLHFLAARTSFADARKINACLPVNNSQPSGPVRLFPAHFPISGATYASVNKAGEQEMMFGKLILGDIVEGSSDSEQLSLENGQYLTVADNASNPTCYFLRRESIRARFMPDGLSSEPRDYECNGLHGHVKAVSTGTLILGMITTVLSVVYSAVCAGSSTALLSPPSSPRTGSEKPLLSLDNIEEG